MAVTDSAKLDYLWKKLGYGLTKTAPPDNKEAYNESIPSPLLYRGDLILTDSGNIPANIPAANTSIITLYQDNSAGNNWSATVECTEDITAPDNRTWKTNLTNWVPIQFGPTYLVKVYVADPGVANPQTVGTQLFQAGSGNNDEWFFDYQSGVLNFNGANIPAVIGTGITNKSVYITGARYTGPLGLGNAGGGTPGGSNTQVQFNDSGSFGGSAGLTYDKDAQALAISGNVTGNYFLGNGALLTGIVTSSYSNANVANYLPTFTGNLAGGNLLINNNAVITGNLRVLGNTTFIDANTLVVGDLDIVVANNAATASDANGAGILVGADGAYASIIWRYDGNLWDFSGNIAADYVFADQAEVVGNLTVLGNVNAATLRTGATTIALGSQAGQNNQGAQAIAIGANAAGTSQGAYAIAIGADSSPLAQGIGAVALGRSAGANSGFQQGNYSLALGYLAGNSQQLDNSIVINATGADLPSASANSFVVKPIRESSAGNILYYDSANGEITYSFAMAGYSNANVAAYLPTYTGNLSAGNILTTGNIETADNLLAGAVAGPGILNIESANQGVVNTGIQLDNDTDVVIYANANVTISTGGDSYFWSFISNGALQTEGNIDISNNYYFGNGAFLTGLDAIAGYSNANVANYLPVYGGNVLADAVLANSLSGNGAAISSITGANVTGVVGNATTAQNVRIQTLGSGGLDYPVPFSLSSGASNSTGLYIDSDVNHFKYNPTTNLLTAGNLSVTSSVSVSFGNITASFGNINTTNGSFNAGRDVRATGNVIGNSVTGGNIQISNVSITGNGEININSGANNNASLQLNDLGNSYITSEQAFVITANSNSNSYSWTFDIDGTLQTSGNINVGSNYYLGNGALLDGLYSNADVANYLPTYTGNLDSLAGNITTTGNVQAAYFIGNILGNVEGNVQVGGANTEVLFNSDGAVGAAPGLTFDYASNVLTVSGNTNSARFAGNGRGIFGIEYANISNAYSNTNVNAFLPGYTGALFNMQGGIITTSFVDARRSNVFGNMFIGNFVSGNGCAISYINGANVFGSVQQAANAANVKLRGAAVSGDYSIVFTNTTTANTSGTDNSQLLIDPEVGAFTYNPVTNTIKTTNAEFSGALGVAGTATVQTLVANANISGGNLLVSNDAVITGNLRVLGNTTFIDANTLVVGDLDIVVANNAATATDANGAGILVGANGAYASMIWRSDSNTWDFSGNVSSDYVFAENIEITSNLLVSGNTTSQYFFGNIVGNTVGDVIGNVTGNIVGNGVGYWTGNTSQQDAVINVTHEPTGFPDPERTQSVISFDNSTRTFYIAPTGSEYSVWVRGQEFVKTGNSNLQIANTTQTNYIYYDTAGNLQSTTNYFDFANIAPVSIVYWNAGTGNAAYFADERHGTTMDWQTHEYLHRTRGAAYVSGFAITADTTGDGDASTDAEIGISSGTFYDEDIQIDVTASASPTVNTFEQDLTLPAKIPVFYRLGTAWVRDTATSYPFKVGTARATYNLNTGGVWSVPDIGSGDFGVMFIVASNNLTYPVLSILGQDTYSNLGQAEQVEWGDLDLTGLPLAELRPLYRICFQTSDSYTNTPKVRMRSVLDIRLEQPVQVSTSIVAQDIAFRETPETVFANDPTANAAWQSWANTTIAANLAAFTSNIVTSGNIVSSASVDAAAIVLGGTSIGQAAITTTATGTQTIANIAASGIEFTVLGTHSGGARQMSTILATGDGTTVDYTQYAAVTLGDGCGTITVAAAGTGIALQVAPANTDSMTFSTQYRIIG